MTETTTAASKTKTTKHATSPFGLPDYGMPKFEMPKFDLANTEMPEAFREMAEKGVEHTRDAYTKARVASEGAVDLLENTYEAAAKRATDYNRKLIAIVRSNTRAAFDNVHELLGAKSPSEFIELSTSHVRKQFEATTEQSKELAELAQKVTTDMVRPLNSGAVDALSQKAD